MFRLIWNRRFGQVGHKVSTLMNMGHEWSSNSLFHIIYDLSHALLLDPLVMCTIYVLRLNDYCDGVGILDDE
jgi:hypothetical protein